MIEGPGRKGEEWLAALSGLRETPAPPLQDAPPQPPESNLASIGDDLSRSSEIRERQRRLDELTALARRLAPGPGGGDERSTAGAHLPGLMGPAGQFGGGHLDDLVQSMQQLAQDKKREEETGFSLNLQPVSGLADAWGGLFGSGTESAAAEQPAAPAGDLTPADALHLQARSADAEARLGLAAPEEHGLDELSEHIARIVTEAVAANRPRTLFGVKMGATAAAPPAAAGAATAPSPPPREPLTRARLLAFAQAHEVLGEQAQHRNPPSSRSDDLAWSLVGMAAQTEGARGVADALEQQLVSGKAGALQAWLRVMGSSSDSRQALGALLGRLVEGVPERTMGLLLLTSDEPGGLRTLARTWSAMSRERDSSLRLAQFWESGARHPAAARGLGELFESMTLRPDDQPRAPERLAGTWSRLSASVGGARRLLQTLESLGEAEGGHRNTARWLARMGRTPEGSRSTMETLLNLAHDRAGATALGSLLARAAESRDGAHDLLACWSSAVETRGAAGRRDVAVLLATLADGEMGGRLLAALARDPQNAAALGQLLSALNERAESRELLAFSLAEMENSPRQRLHLDELETHSPVWQWLGPALDPSGKRRPAALGRRLEEDEDLAQTEAPRRKRFRPGDVYSQATLRRARLCRECGGRTDELGRCGACGAV